MYTLPFFTNSETQERIAQIWTAEPLFSLSAVGASVLFLSKIVSERPPVVFVGLDEALIADGYIARLRSIVSDSSYDPHIVAITESTTEHVIVAAFEQGADRAIALPTCSARIFRSLVKSLLNADRRQMCFAPYSFDLAGQTVIVGEKEIRLRHKSFTFAHFLFANNGRYVPKDTLLLEVWGLQRACQTRRVESQVSYVKKMLFLDGTYGWTLQRRRGYGLFYNKASSH